MLFNSIILNVMTRQEAEAYKREIERLRAKLNTEIALKNIAYAFILESGLLEQYREYSNRELYGSDSLQTCRDYIAGEARKRGIV